VGAVAVLLFISGVTACASAHGLPLSVSVVAEAYRRRGGKVLWGLLLAGFTFFRAIFHILPIAGPLLAPFEFEVAALAILGREAILGFCLHGNRLALQTNLA